MDYMLESIIYRVIFVALLYVIQIDQMIGQPVTATDSTTLTCLPDRGEVLIRSSEGNANSGWFKSPPMHSPSRIIGRHSRCVYRFVARSRQKVHLKIAQFLLPGRMPNCSQSFVDVYIDVASSSLDHDRDKALLLHQLQEASRSTTTTTTTREPLTTTTPFSAEVYSKQLDKSDLLGRFCGGSEVGTETSSSPMLEFVSLHREIVLDAYLSPFATNGQGLDWNEDHGFEGTFEFIDDARYYPGRALANNELGVWHSATPSCSFRVEAGSASHDSRDPATEDSWHPKMDSLPGITGYLESPTFPGLHPNNLVCVYQLIGFPGQRINIDVLRLDLPEDEDGACIVDSLTFYDGVELPSHEGQPITGSSFCGRNRQLRLVSSESSMLVVFQTGYRSIFDQDDWSMWQSRSGFRLRYTFSSHLLPVKSQYRDWHIVGTECDYMIRSNSEPSKGDRQRIGSSSTAVNQFDSPTFDPTSINDDDLFLAPNRACSFYFVGQLGNRQFEAVRLGFESIDWPLPDRVSTNKAAVDSRCKQGFLAVYGSRSRDGLHQLTSPVLSSKQPINKRRHSPSFNNILTNQIEPDFTWCGRDLDYSWLVSGVNDLPIVSRGPVLKLELNSTGASAPGLKVKFRALFGFERSYGVPGQPIGGDGGSHHQSLCHFFYQPLIDSTSQQPLTSGWTNSPFYPITYPANVDCVMAFVPSMVGEQSIASFGAVQLTFEQFALGSTAVIDTSRGTHQGHEMMSGSRNCDQDSLELYKVPLSSQPTLSNELVRLANDLVKTTSISQSSSFTPINVYCDRHSPIPGPIKLLMRQSTDESSSSSTWGLFLRFRSRSPVETRMSHGTGFLLNYQFLSSASVDQNDCKANLSVSSEHVGLLQSPNHPEPYPSNTDCEWTIQGEQADVDGKILINFEHFQLDGTAFNCSVSVLRIYAGNQTHPLYELCGEHDEQISLIVSNSQARIRFISVDNSAKAVGFRLVWSQLLSTNDQGDCPGFRCHLTRYCIPTSLQCNSLNNCGRYLEGTESSVDDSDETTNCGTTSSHNFAQIGIGVVSTFVLLLLIVAIVCCRERRRRRKQHHIDPLAELTGSKQSIMCSRTPSQRSTASSQCRVRPVGSNHHRHHQQKNRHHSHHNQHHRHFAASKTLSHHHHHHHGRMRDRNKTSRSSLSLNRLPTSDQHSSVCNTLDRKPRSHRTLHPPPLPLHHQSPPRIASPTPSSTSLIPRAPALTGRLQRRSLVPAKSNRHGGGLMRITPTGLHSMGDSRLPSSHSTGPNGAASDGEGGFYIREKMQKISIV